MKKITLLCRVEERNETVKSLRDLGVLHIVGLKSAAGDDLDQTRERLVSTRRALEVFPRETESFSNHPADDGEKKESEIIEQIIKLEDLKNILIETIADLKLERERIAPLGDFDPRKIKRLETRGIMIQLFTSSTKKLLKAAPGTVLEILSEKKGVIYFALIGAPEAFSKDIPYQPYKMPAFSLSKTSEMIIDRERELTDILEKLEHFEVWKNAISKRVQRLEEHQRFLEVRESMGGSERIAALQGFCPVPLIDSLRKAAIERHWGIAVEDPEPGESVPTLIYYPRLVRPIKGIFDMLKILPGYRESDISIPFLVFFSLFFAMLIGDAGYGVILLVITLVARSRLKSSGPEPFHLLGILSVATIIWGVMTGNYFGITTVPAPLAELKVDWLNDHNNLMKLSFLIGAIHLTLAHVWNAINYAPNGKALAQLGWIFLTWTMYFAAGAMVLKQPFPSWVVVLFGVGMILIILFMTPFRELKKEWINHAILPLNVISCFVDVVSYVRLFAVGMATLSVAQSFNNMALAAGFNSVLSSFVSAMILFLGHSLNILLCGLGILVHGVRLNTLEFSLHKDMQWSGYPYMPFTRDKN